MACDSSFSQKHIFMQHNFTHPTLMSLEDCIPTPHLSQANHAEPVLIPPYYDAHGVGDYNAMVGWCYKQQSRARAASSHAATTSC